MGTIPDGDLFIPAKAASDALDAISHDRLTVAGTAEHDAPFGLTPRHGLGDRPDEIRVVARGLGVRPVIADRMALREQHGFDLFLVVEPGVIRTNGDREVFHKGERGSEPAKVAGVVISVTLIFSKQNTSMRLITFLLVSLSLGFFSACSTPDSRISAGQAAFAQYPAAVQQKIRAGQVDVGFTPEMVRMALGKPNRSFVRKTEAGDTEVWGYHDNTPRFSFGVGVGSGGYHSGTAVGVGMSTGGYDPEEKIRVEFRAGLVTAVEVLK